MKLASTQQIVAEPGKLAFCNKSVCGLVKQRRRARYVADAMKGAKSSRPEDWHFSARRAWEAARSKQDGAEE
eukprot:1464607-Alexandrium_andersonii.AAC.1